MYLSGTKVSAENSATQAEAAAADLPEREHPEHGAARCEQMHRPRQRVAGGRDGGRAVARHPRALSSTGARTGATRSGDAPRFDAASDPEPRVARTGEARE